MMNKEEAIKLGTKMIRGGASTQDAVASIMKKGGVKSKHNGKTLNPQSIRVILGEAIKRAPVKTHQDNMDALQEQLYRNRINAAFVDLKISFLKTGKTSFTFDEVTSLIEKVGAQTI